MSDDLISRKWLMEVFENYPFDTEKDKNRVIHVVRDTAPSVEQDVIYCGECKYKDDGLDEDGIPFLKCLHGRSYGGTRINDFCSWAERID